MPRVVTEELVGCGIRIEWADIPDIDPQDGQLRKRMDGQPRTIRVAIIVVQDLLPNGVPHITRIPLDQEGRQTIIRELTGGITVPEIAVVQ